jgi:hypothetical protein
MMINNNKNFKQKLSSFYDYLERNERIQQNEDNDDDTKSCINMKFNYHQRKPPGFSNNNQNVLKLLNNKQAQKNDEEIYSCLFTPRLTNKRQPQQKDSSYLTWKTFNCNPIPSFTKETAIINEDDDSQQVLSSNKTYRCNFSNQNLGVIYDNDECDLNNKENFNYSRDKKTLSVSTPGTPLLSSSCTLPR